MTDHLINIAWKASRVLDQLEPPKDGCGPTGIIGPRGFYPAGESYEKDLVESIQSMLTRISQYL